MSFNNKFLFVFTFEGHRIRMNYDTIKREENNKKTNIILKQIKWQNRIILINK